MRVDSSSLQNSYSKQQAFSCGVAVVRNVPYKVTDEVIKIFQNPPKRIFKNENKPTFLNILSFVTRGNVIKHDIKLNKAFDKACKSELLPQASFREKLFAFLQNENIIDGTKFVGVEKSKMIVADARCDAESAISILRLDGDVDLFKVTDKVVIKGDEFWNRGSRVLNDTKSIVAKSLVVRNISYGSLFNTEIIADCLNAKNAHFGDVSVLRRNADLTDVKLGNLEVVQGKATLKKVNSEEVSARRGVKGTNVSVNRVRSDGNGRIDLANSVVKESITADSGEISLKKVSGYPAVVAKEGDVYALECHIGSVEHPEGFYWPEKTVTGQPVIKGRYYVPDKESTVNGEVEAFYVPFRHKWSQFTKSFIALFKKPY